MYALTLNKFFLATLARSTCAAVAPSAMRSSCAGIYASNILATLNGRIGWKADNSDRPLVFAPAGKRAILRDLKRGLKPGDRLQITFNVEPAPR